MLSTKLIVAQELMQYSNGQLLSYAEEAELSSDYETAIIYYQEYLSRKSDKVKIRYKLAEAYRHTDRYVAAVKEYEVIRTKNEAKFPLAAFHQSSMLLALQKCDEAIPILDDFRKAYRGQSEDRKYRRLAKTMIQSCYMRRGDSILVDPLIVKPMNTTINGIHMEASPIFITDSLLIYNSLKLKGTNVFKSEDKLPERAFYTAEFRNNEWMHKNSWETVRLKDDGLNISNGAFNLDKTRFYFSVCWRTTLGKLNCDLYRKEKVDGEWEDAKPLGEVINTKYIETQVAVGLDDKNRETIYFVSDRPGGKGEKDLWYSTYYEKAEKFKEPRNMGSKINSAGDELTPFINPSNLKLYFSSDGHPGYGQLDVFESIGSKSKWEEPKNIGRNINSSYDELYYTLAPSNNAGAFVSNRDHQLKNKVCCDDIFYYTDPNYIVLRYRGKVNAEDGEDLGDAQMKIYVRGDSAEEAYLTKLIRLSSDGSFNFQLEAGQDYNLEVVKEGYFTTENQISTKNDISSANRKLEFNLEVIPEEPLALANILYELNQSKLSESTKRALDTTLLLRLKKNPTLVVEISSHTDASGSAAYNKSLSQKRAQNVVNYLISKGIEKNRLKAVGYGESQPLFPNENPDGSPNEENREKNRRTEFKVIGAVEVDEEED